MSRFNSDGSCYQVLTCKYIYNICLDSEDGDEITIKFGDKFEDMRSFVIYIYKDVMKHDKPKSTYRFTGC